MTNTTKRIPHSECIQGRCANITTGCWGECSIRAAFPLNNVACGDAAQPRVSEQANERALFMRTIDSTYPIPNTPHQSVAQRAMDNREAFSKGWGQAWAALTQQAAPEAPASEQLVGEIVMFGSDLKEVSWRKGKKPAPGTKLYASLPATTASASGEAIYQVKSLMHPHGWHDIHRDEYEWHKATGVPVRIAYRTPSPSREAAPQAAAEDARDAARYRWLRDNSNSGLDASENVQLVVLKRRATTLLARWTANPNAKFRVEIREAIDEVVDAAIASHIKAGQAGKEAA